MVSVANNVVTMVRVANAGAVKDSGTKSNSDTGERGSSDAQVTVLFPRSKMNAGNWQKAQKVAADKSSDTTKDDDGSDQLPTEDMFGSLVASVEQKLMRQDDQTMATDDKPASEISTDASTLRGPRFMGLGSLSQSVQLMARGATDTVKTTDDFQALASDQLTTVKTALDVAETEKSLKLPVLDATAAQKTGTEVESQTAAEAKASSDITVVDVKALSEGTAIQGMAITDIAVVNVKTLSEDKVVPGSLDSDIPAVNLKAVSEDTVVEGEVISEIPTFQGKLPKVSTPGQTDAKPTPDRVTTKADSFSVASNEVKSVKPVQTVGQSVDQGGDAGTVVDPVNLQTSANGNAVKSKGEEKQTLEPIKGDEPRRVDAKATAASDSASISSVTMGDGKLLSPAAQIVENIKNAVPASAAAAPEYVTTAPQMVKTLEIQLQPEGLGPVTVSLKSEQGKLKVQISAKLDTTRQELERSAVELIGGLKAVDPTFTDNDVNFSSQNQGAAADSRGQTFSNGNDRRGTPENMPGFGSNGGQDANQSGARARNGVSERLRSGQAAAAGDLSSSVDRADGIYL